MEDVFGVPRKGRRNARQPACQPCDGRILPREMRMQMFDSFLESNRCDHPGFEVTKRLDRVPIAVTKSIPLLLDKVTCAEISMPDCVSFASETFTDVDN